MILADDDKKKEAREAQNNLMHLSFGCIVLFGAIRKAKKLGMPKDELKQAIGAIIDVLYEERGEQDGQKTEDGVSPTSS